MNGVRITTILIFSAILSYVTVAKNILSDKVSSLGVFDYLIASINQLNVLDGLSVVTFYISFIVFLISITILSSLINKIYRVLYNNLSGVKKELKAISTKYNLYLDKINYYEHKIFSKSFNERDNEAINLLAQARLILNGLQPRVDLYDRIKSDLSSIETSELKLILENPISFTYSRVHNIMNYNDIKQNEVLEMTASDACKKLDAIVPLINAKVLEIEATKEVETLQAA